MCEIKYCPECGKEMQKIKSNFQVSPVSSTTVTRDEIWKCFDCDVILRW